MVHFHNPKDLYLARNQLRSYRGLVLLTSHSPKPWHCELREAESAFEQHYLDWFYRGMDYVDFTAFKRADYIIFPCKDAEEPYYENWRDYPEIHHALKDKYRYLLTGSVDCSARIDVVSYRKSKGIAADSFVLSFVGRHNATKGYDIFCNITEQLIAKDGSYCALVGGRKTTGCRDSSNWIEVGWTDDPHSLIAASDVFILPNRETYFDLVLLEALALGVVVVASNAGGNKHFAGQPGIFLFDTVEQAVSIVERVRDMGTCRRKELGDLNRSLFLEEYNASVFASNYCTLIDKLVKANS